MALIDARTSAATGGMGISWWHARVAAGEAPKPVIQQPRMTRWRLADVRAFWAQRAQAGSADAGENMQAQAIRASAAAARKRDGTPTSSTNAG
ncbi:helix-turn-helix transcriptional regulator [Inhella sp.]|uniref:helix-turn-helix transcriptional regulator n=1 Tax=Inhella sp. TaxID=1921806 RepID=UPI0035AEEAAC